ncbi:hypothetical protein RI129_002775 [Pyrocoelia pectoralis]|uniref:DUF7869 domain-containing protein n=1 Tax=Pyrocoelia pectoralis TaxID=417401 RepID=A0AAN7VNL6_9COLE
MEVDDNMTRNVTVDSCNNDGNVDRIDTNAHTIEHCHEPTSENSKDEDENKSVNNQDNGEILEDVDNVEINVGRTRRLKSNEKEWKRTKNKKLRMEGKSYLGFSRLGDKILQNKNRLARCIKPTCDSTFCRKSKMRHCETFLETTRQQIFREFWECMNWDQRKVFVCSNVIKAPTFRKTANENSRRKGSYSYSLNNNTKTLKVCRKMFLNTLDLGYKTVQEWVNNGSYGMYKETGKRINVKEKIVLRHKAHYTNLETFFGELPKLPAHYCRKDTMKLYLEPIFQNLSDVYKLYKTYCHDKNVEPLGRKVFNKTFYAHNLSIYQPKKDQCNICFAYKYDNVSEDKYKSHLDRKEKARKEKIKDKAAAENNHCIVVTMDLQGVKLAPVIPASKVYFKTKLSCHNFTVYNLKTRDVMCYWFSEDENNSLVSSTFASCILDYLERYCITESKIPIILYSDGCNYQNRNAVLANALLNFSIVTEIEVFQKYLEPGHTQMECDSVHSTIERKLRNKEIHLPSDYSTITREARTNPKPYEEKKPHDPVITDIKSIKYSDHKIQVKLDFDSDYCDLPSRPKVGIPVIMQYPPLLKSRCKIKEEKYKHLQELLEDLPKDTHLFYNNLLH